MTGTAGVGTSINGEYVSLHVGEDVMSDPQPPAISNLETSIHNLARIVRDARHIDPDAQKRLPIWWMF